MSSSHIQDARQVPTPQQQQAPPSGQGRSPCLAVDKIATGSASSDLSNRYLAPPSTSSWAHIHAQQGPCTPTSVCGKRSRSNSSSSSGYSSDGGFSTFSNASQPRHLVESPATSLSASDDDDELRTAAASPSAGKRKALRRAWRHDACTAAEQDARLPASASAKEPAARSHAASLSPSPNSGSDSDVNGLDGAVQDFGLSSREPSPESSREPSSALRNANSGNATIQPSKVNLVDHLVDAAVATIEAIWHSPLAKGENRAEMPPCTASALPLPHFIRETLRRSRTSCSTLQAALLYCLRCAPAVRKQRHVYQNTSRAERDEEAAKVLADQAGLAHPLLCGRRIFLASVMVASKFLQDKNFSNRAWSRLTGLPLKQLGLVEREFLAAIGWDLNVKQDEWECWVKKLTEARFSKPAQQSSATVTTAAAVVPLPAAAVISAPHKAVALLKGSGVEEPQQQEQQQQSARDRSESSTPTPSTLRPRANLARIHSEDGPLRAFDASVAASSSANPAMASSTPTGTVSAKEGAAKTPAVHRHLTPTPEMAYPYPMPRAFVRSAHSFSSGDDRLAAMQYSQPQPSVQM